MNNITPKEAIANLNHLYGMVSPDMQRSLDVVIKAVERPSGDAISREALKDIAYINKGNFNTIEGIREWIDNAQAVDTTCPNCDSGYAQGYSDGYLKGKEERPQGEWIYHDKLNMYYCKDCGLLEPFTKEEIEEGIKLPNFCQQCGAKMVTYTGKDRDTKGGAE